MFERDLQKRLDSLTKGLADFAKAEPPTQAPAPARAREPEAREDASPRPALLLAKNCLNGGEISPFMAGRIDQGRYQTGCHSLLNMVPLPCGGATKRPGFRFAGAAGSNTGAARLLEFVFSATESRLLEFFERPDGKSAFRVWTLDANGHPALSPQTFSTPWPGRLLREISFCQSGDVIYCAHESFPPCKIMRFADDDFRCETIVWAPSIKPPTVAAANWTGNTQDGVAWTHHYYVATAIDKDTGAESAPCAVIHVGSQPLRSDLTVKIWFEPREDIAEFRVYKRDGGVYGYVGRVNEPDGAGDWVFEDDNIAADTEDTPPEHRDPFAEPNHYPSIVFLHQQRLGFASSRAKPLAVWLSPTANYESMASSQPPRDDDAIEATLVHSQANRILWARSDRHGLAIGTAGGEWLLVAPDAAALTPKNLSFQPQSSYGSEPFLAPLAAGSALLFVQRGARVIRDLAYNFSDDRYQSADLSILARHILANSPVRAWTYQAEPYGIVWAALANGSLAGLTYLREHEIIAWHRHTTQGKILEVAAIPAPTGATTLIALIERESTRNIEYLDAFPTASSNSTTFADGPDNLPYPARLIPCIAPPEPTAFLNPLKINAVKCRVLNSAPFKCRVLSQFAQPSKPLPVPARPAQPPKIIADNPPPIADWSCPIGSGFRDNAQIELILDGPNNAAILAIAATCEVVSNAKSQM